MTFEDTNLFCWTFFVPARSRCCFAIKSSTDPTTKYHETTMGFICSRAITAEIASTVHFMPKRHSFVKRIITCLFITNFDQERPAMLADSEMETLMDLTFALSGVPFPMRKTVFTEWLKNSNTNSSRLLIEFLANGQKKETVVCISTRIAVDGCEDRYPNGKML